MNDNKYIFSQKLHNEILLMNKVVFNLTLSNEKELSTYMKANTAFNKTTALNHILEQYFSKPKEDTVLLDRLDNLEELIKGDLQKVSNACYQTLERVYKIHLAFNHISAVGSELGLPKELSKELINIYHSEEIQKIINQRLNTIKEL